MTKTHGDKTIDDPDKTLPNDMTYNDIEENKKLDDLMTARLLKTNESR